MSLLDRLTWSFVKRANRKRYARILIHHNVGGPLSVSHDYPIQQKQPPDPVVTAFLCHFYSTQERKARPIIVEVPISCSMKKKPSRGTPICIRHCCTSACERRVENLRG